MHSKPPESIDFEIAWCVVLHQFSTHHIIKFYDHQILSHGAKRTGQTLTLRRPNEC